MEIHKNRLFLFSPESTHAQNTHLIRGYTAAYAIIRQEYVRIRDMVNKQGRSLRANIGIHWENATYTTGYAIIRGVLWEAHLGVSSGPPIFTQLGGSLKSVVFSIKYTTKQTFFCLGASKDPFGGPQGCTKKLTNTTKHVYYAQNTTKHV